jgi:tripeptidyl-peptidase-1
MIANTFAPHPETKKTVIDWLVESGVDRSRLSLSNGGYTKSYNLL